MEMVLGFLYPLLVGLGVGSRVIRRPAFSFAWLPDVTRSYRLFGRMRMKHEPEGHTVSGWLRRARLRTADVLVALANRLIRKWTCQAPAVWPLYRPVDIAMPEITGSKWQSGAYSYEHLRSLVEQDGPDGFGATATVRWLLSD